METKRNIRRKCKMIVVVVLTCVVMIGIGLEGKEE